MVHINCVPPEELRDKTAAVRHGARMPQRWYHDRRPGEQELATPAHQGTQLDNSPA